MNNCICGKPASKILCSNSTNTKYFCGNNTCMKKINDTCISYDMCWHYTFYCVKCGINLHHLEGNGFNRCEHFDHVMCDKCDKERGDKCTFVFDWERMGFF